MSTRIVFRCFKDALAFAAAAANGFKADAVVGLCIEERAHFDLRLIGDVINTDDIHQRVVACRQQGFGT